MENKTKKDKPVSMIVLSVDPIEQIYQKKISMRSRIDTQFQDDSSSLETMITAPSSRAHWEDDMLQLERIIEEGPAVHDLGDEKSVHSFDLPDPDMWEVHSFDCGNSLSSENFNLTDLEPGLGMDLTSLIADVQTSNDNIKRMNSRPTASVSDVISDYPRGDNNLAPSPAVAFPLNSYFNASMKDYPVSGSQEASRQADTPLDSLQKDNASTADCLQQGYPASNRGMNMNTLTSQRRKSLPPINAETFMKYQSQMQCQNQLYPDQKQRSEDLMDADCLQQGYPVSNRGVNMNTSTSQRRKSLSSINTETFTKYQSRMQCQNQLYPDQKQRSEDLMDERLRLLELNMKQGRGSITKFEELSQNNYMHQYAYSTNNTSLKQMHDQTSTVSMPELSRKRNVGRLQQFDMDVENSSNIQSPSLHSPNIQEIRESKAFSTARRVTRRLSNDSVASSVHGSIAHSIAPSSAYDQSIASSLAQELCQSTAKMTFYPGLLKRDTKVINPHGGVGLSSDANVTQSDLSNHSYTNANVTQSDLSNHSGTNANTSRSDHNNLSGMNAHTAWPDYSNQSGTNANAMRPDHSNHLGMNANISRSDHSNHSGMNAHTAWPDYSNQSGTNANTSRSDHNNLSGMNAHTAWPDYSNQSGMKGNAARSDYSNHSGTNANPAWPDYSNLSGMNANTARSDYSNHSGSIFSLCTSAIACAPMSDGNAVMGKSEISPNNGQYQGKPVIEDSDRQFATAFSFAVLSEVESCEFGPKDITGKRVGLKEGFKGLACRHCRGSRRLGGRLFPSKIKTMSDTNKTLIPLFRHLLKCPSVSDKSKKWLEECKVNHEDERKNQKKYGSQKAFFTRIWERLHGDVPS